MESYPGKFRIPWANFLISLEHPEVDNSTKKLYEPEKKFDLKKFSPLPTLTLDP